RLLPAAGGAARRCRRAGPRRGGPPLPGETKTQGGEPVFCGGGQNGGAGGGNWGFPGKARGGGGPPPDTPVPPRGKNNPTPRAGGARAHRPEARAKEKRFLRSRFRLVDTSSDGSPFRMVHRRADVVSSR